jgi:ribosomal protein S18 acetylase RimI-like enzyme
MSGTRFAIAPVRSPLDVADTARLFRAYAASLRVDLAYQDFTGEVANLPGAYAPPGGELLLARGPSEEALGCVALRPMVAAGRCEIKRLYVLPEARGIGLGRALLDAVLADAARLGYREVRLDTLPDMAEAMALYSRAGFVPIAPYYDTPVAGTRFLGLMLGPVMPD